MKKIRIRMRYRIIALTLLVVAVALGVFVFVDAKVFQTNAHHLQEVYHQVNSTFTTTVSRNWRLLTEWSVYADHLLQDGEEAALTDYLEQSKQRWGIADIYFLADNGDYVKLNGEQGHFDLAHDLGRENGYTVTGVDTDDGSGLTVFSAPTAPNTYRGFAYTTLALSFDDAALETQLNIATYGGAASTYVVFPDGRPLYSYNPITEQEDYFARLENDAEFINGSAEEFREAIQTGTDSAFMIKVDGARYYLVCQNIEFLNWKLLGVVPLDAVNADMLHIQLLSIAVAAFFLIALAVLSIWYLHSMSKQQLQKKDVALKQQEQMFNTLVTRSSDIFVMFSVGSFAVEYVSPNIRTILGLPLEELRKDLRALSKTAISIGDDPDWDELKNIPIGGSIRLVRERIHQESGERRWFQETAHHCAFEDSDKIVLVLSERTDEIQAQQRLEVAVRLAKSANEAKSIFLSNMSHDIRTPINAIIGFSLLLNQDSENPAKVQDYTRKITSSSRHLLSLINDVLDMSKIESGKVTLNVTEFHLGTLLEDINVVIRPQTVAKHQRFDLRVRGIREDMLMGDPTRISQVLQNLLTNAVKYTDTGGHVELLVTQQESSSDRFARLQFQVIDNGIGISKEYQDVMFDSFSRELNTTLSGVHGTGLGLAITKNLVDLMGGTIEVESEKGEGSTFTVTLDLLVSETKWSDSFWQECGINKVLIVDDEENLCLDIQNTLSNLGMDARYATNGDTAVEMVAHALIDAKPYDLILLDWVLGPHTDNSLDVARRILKESLGHSILLVMTAYDWSSFEDAARDVGVHAFMHKPFFLTDFHHVVQHLRRKGASLPEAKAKQTEELSSMAGLRILAAEDNELNAEILLELLELEGAHCELAENGQIALDKFLNSKPGYYDVILMDVQMPIMSGYDATEAIRRSSHPDAATIPISAMTANAFAEDIKNALDSGMNAHIAKPLDMSVLKATVTQLVAHRRSKQDSQPVT